MAAAWRRWRGDPLALVGAGLLLLLLVLAVAAPLLAPWPPNEVAIRQILQPPSPSHPLGTDLLGRDVLARILYGGRATLTIGVLVVGLAFLIGVAAGMVAGFLGGWVDWMAMRVADAMLSFPALVLAIALAAAFGPSLANAMLAVALTLAPQFARLARAQAVLLTESLPVRAARSFSIPTRRILTRYVLRNGIGPLLTQASLSIGTAILQVASLGFLGLGAQPPLAEWGADIAANLESLRGAPWVIAAPAAAILVAVLAFNLLSDALAERIDPRLRAARAG